MARPTLRLIDPAHQEWADQAVNAALAIVANAHIELPKFDLLAHALIVAHRSSTAMHADTLEHGGREAGDLAVRWLRRNQAWMVADVTPDGVACVISVAGEHMPIGIAVDDDEPPHPMQCEGVSK